LWFSGAGLIGAGVAGIAAGTMAISLTGSPAGTATNSNALGMIDQSYGGTVFSSTPPDWSDQ
jgi:hypothetical protein